MSLSQKDMWWSVNTDSQVKKKYLVERPGKKVYSDSFLDPTEFITLRKGGTINSVFYFKFLRQYFTLFIVWPSYVHKTNVQLEIMKFWYFYFF